MVPVEKPALFRVIEPQMVTIDCGKQLCVACITALELFRTPFARAWWNSAVRWAQIWSQRKRRASAARCDDHGNHSTINKLSAQIPGSSTVEHSAVNRRVASSNLARGANLFNQLARVPAVTASDCALFCATSPAEIGSQRASTASLRARSPMCP